MISFFLIHLRWWLFHTLNFQIYLDLLSVISNLFYKYVHLHTCLKYSLNSLIVLYLRWSPLVYLHFLTCLFWYMNFKIDMWVYKLPIFNDVTYLSWCTDICLQICCCSISSKHVVFFYSFTISRNAFYRREMKPLPVIWVRDTSPSLLLLFVTFTNGGKFLYTGCTKENVYLGVFFCMLLF